MRSVGKCRLEEFIYRFTKALLLVLFLIYFQQKLNLFSEFGTVYTSVMLAVLTQLLLLKNCHRMIWCR